MKKNYLTISLFILSMIFSFTFKPLNVKADPITEPASEETTTNPTDENEGIKEEEEEEEKEEPEVKKTEGEEKQEEVPADKAKGDAQPADEPTEESKGDAQPAGEPTEGAKEDAQPAGEPIEGAKEEAPTTEPTTSDEPVDSNTTTELQKAKVSFTKVNEEGNLLPGAILQILDSDGEIVAEWETTDKAYEFELSAGNYTLHEKKAPDGYEAAADIPFKVEIVINEDVVGTVTNFTDPTNHESQLYYVTINHDTYEVYCINQGLKTPDGNEYTGKILTSEDIRKFTKQETNVDKIDENGKRTYDFEYRQIPGYKGTAFYAQYETISDYDVSDQTMSDQELYDKTLDIIYHRNKVQEKFNDIYTEQEIRFITEWALKNYLNARITTGYETIRYFKTNGQFGHYSYYVGPDGQPLMDENEKPLTTNPDGSAATGTKYYGFDHKPYYREYRYAPGEEGAINDVIIDPGKGDSFGHMAKGLSQDERVKYATLYYYLVGDDNNDGKYDHPEDMELYMYSPNTEYTDENGNIIYYQNVLGIAGFFKDVKIVGTDVELTDNYSTEKTSATVKKVWNDNDNQDGKRPESITVKLSNGESVTLNEDNNWEATINDLPKYDKGKLINYTWEEVNLPEGYKLTSSVDGVITTLTNTYTPETRNIKVNKVWYDDDNEYQVRAKEVTVNVLADGEIIKTITLNEDNNWEETLDNLPVYKNGNKIKYEVSEFEVEYYKVIIEENKEGFTIYNYYDAKGGETPPPSPQTSDSIILSIILLISSICGISASIYLKKKNN